MLLRDREQGQRSSVQFSTYQSQWLFSQKSGSLISFVWYLRIRSIKEMLVKHRPVWGNPRQSWILDSRLRIENSLSVEHGFQLRFQSSLWFRIRWGVFRIPKPWIPDSTAKIEKKFRNTDSLYMWRKTSKLKPFFRSLLIADLCFFFSDLVDNSYLDPKLRVIKQKICIIHYCASQMISIPPIFRSQLWILKYRLLKSFYCSQWVKNLWELLAY